MNDLEMLFEELKNQLRSDDIWDDFELGDFSLNVGHIGKFDFSLRTSEQPHYKAHFHVVAGACSGSYSIKPVLKLAGNFKPKDDKIIVAWAQEHQKELIDKWNKIHPGKVI